MTHVEIDFLTAPVGNVYQKMNEIVGSLTAIGRREYGYANTDRIINELSETESRLRQIQTSISQVSMHLPTGFSALLSRQFADMLDEDAWEDEDEIPSDAAISNFLRVLMLTSASKCPSIGTNGKGSITAAWINGESRLIVECLLNDNVSWVLTRSYDDRNPESAAAECPSNRLPAVLAPYGPEVWFAR